MNFKEQYNTLFNDHLSVVVKMAESFKDLVNDKDFTNDVEKKQVAFQKKVIKVFSKKDAILIKAYVNNVGNTYFGYEPLNLVPKDLSRQAAYLSDNTILINCDEKIINRIDMGVSKRLPTVPSAVCKKLYNDSRLQFIMGVDAAKINKILGSDFKVENFNDYYEKAQLKAANKKLTIADAKIFNDGTRSYNDIKNKNYVMFINTNKEYFNENGEVVASIKNNKFPTDYCYFIKNALNLDCEFAVITNGDFKRLKKVWSNAALPVWTNWLKANVNQKVLQDMYNSRLEKTLNGATGMFGSYLRNEYQILENLSKTMTFTKKQNEYMNDLKFVLDFNTSIDNRCSYKERKYIMQIADAINIVIDTSKKEEIIGPDFNAKYPFKDIVNTYNNDDVEQVKKYLHLVEVW